MFPRQPSSCNLADPDKGLTVFFVFSCCGPCLFRLSTKRPALAYFSASWLFLTVEPMAPCQPSMANVADSGVFLGSVSCFVPCVSANGLTTSPLGTTFQALFLCDRHGMIRVPFCHSDIVSASKYYPCCDSHPCAKPPRPSCFFVPIATNIS